MSAAVDANCRPEERSRISTALTTLELRQLWRQQRQSCWTQRTSEQLQQYLHLLVESCSTPIDCISWASCVQQLPHLQAMPRVSNTTKPHPHSPHALPHAQQLCQRRRNAEHPLAPHPRVSCAWSVSPCCRSVWDDYEADTELIGRGAFARVFRAIRRDDGSPVAIKVIGRETKAFAQQRRGEHTS